jgi:hypothetical protein
MKYMETTIKIATKLRSVFYLIYKLTSVQEKNRSRNGYGRMMDVAENTSKTQ